MPELPEVETTVRGLRRKVLKRIFFDVWTDTPQKIRCLVGGVNQGFLGFQKAIKQRRILAVKRFGKNIVLGFSEGWSLLIHQKMTGHLLYGQWQRKNNIWVAKADSAIKSDPMNRFLHLVLFLDNGWQLALSDVRKFAKIELWRTAELAQAKDLKVLGPDALAGDFTLAKFQQAIGRKKGKIKQILMDQTVMAGVGNIYADEILFAASLHPTRIVADLTALDYQRMYRAMRSILRKAVTAGGTSSSDYRDINGEKGGFAQFLKVYRRNNQKCYNCGEVIKRLKLAGRSSHFCPHCQE